MSTAGLEAGIVSTLVGSVPVGNGTRSAESCGSRACSGNPQVVPSVMLPVADVKPAPPAQAASVLPATITPVAVAVCGLKQLHAHARVAPDRHVGQRAVVALPAENSPCARGGGSSWPASSS